MTKRLPLVAAIAGALGLLAPRAASADAGPSAKEACIATFDAAQQHRSDGQLKRAREELVACTQRECPAVLRVDCAEVLRQVESAQPSIILKAVDAAGHDLLDVTVEMNGEVLATALDGRAITVDPGKLSIVFRHPPYEPATVVVLLRETEKQRLVTATFGASDGPVAERPAPPAVKEEPPPPPAGAPSRGVVGWVVPASLAALGVAALTVAGVRRLDLGSEADTLRETCGVSCPSTERDRLSSELVTTNVILGAGIGALALAVGSWFVLAPSRPSRAAVMWDGRLRF